MVVRANIDSREGFEYEPTPEDWAEYGEYLDEVEDDGQPDEWTEWQDVYGGDDWDQGQYDEW